MFIRFTNTAAERIREKIGDRSAFLKLAYDTEGCGCAVNGVAQLWIVEEPPPHDARASGDPFSVIYDPNHEVFFEDQMVVDYIERTRTYKLSSSSQIYNAFMPLLDKRPVVLK